MRHIRSDYRLNNKADISEQAVRPSCKDLLKNILGYWLTNLQAYPTEILLTMMTFEFSGFTCAAITLLQLLNSRQVVFLSLISFSEGPKTT